MNVRYFVFILLYIPVNLIFKILINKIRNERNEKS